ncbi:MAG TPA: hypothetical protein PKD10_00070 [Paracoccaceae bacterium]|nr:hypothetical protein [Paracoccaceae bacterium]HMO70040.1 hypothetical protein [Paracoccaceae bacterium]
MGGDRKPASGRWGASRSGGTDAPDADLLAAIRDLDVRLIVLPPVGGPADAGTLLGAAGATERQLASGHVLWSVPARFDQARPAAGAVRPAVSRRRRHRGDSAPP